MKTTIALPNYVTAQSSQCWRLWRTATPSFLHCNVPNLDYPKGTRHTTTHPNGKGSRNLAGLVPGVCTPLFRRRLRYFRLLGRRNIL